MGYQQGLSGLSGASNDLDVIGNNIANANTVGFKQGQAQFADMYANSVATAVNNQIGIGSQMSEVQQQFGQGTITTTSQALDVAINGNGFSRCRRTVRTCTRATACSTWRPTARSSTQRARP